MIYAVLAGVALLAGLVQGVTGFGAGLVMMMALPYFFPLPQSAGMATAISILLCAVMVVRYRKDAALKKAAPASALYLIVCSLTIQFSTLADPAVMKKIFGAFLLALSVYYLFFNRKGPTKPLALPAALLCIAVSAVCDGLFGIGGPLMVLYFLSVTASTREYLGTLQVFFLINSVYNTGFRVFRGILGAQHLPFILVGMAGIAAGVFVANRIVDKLNAGALRKLTYVMIGVSGVVNLLQ